MDSATVKKRFSEFNLDPALAEMVEAAPAQQIIEGIIRLEDPDQVPSHFRVVSRFKRICTGRFAAAHAWAIRRHPNVISLKAARPLGIHDDGGDWIQTPAGRKPRRFTPPFTGRGSILAALDFGFDFAHPNFLNGDGTTRLVGFWHQGAPYDPTHPNRFGYGRLFSPQEINAALRTSDPYRALGYHPAISDPGGTGSHGTHTMDIAAGNGRARGSEPGAAPDANLIFVHLSTPRFDRHVVGDLGDSVRLLEGLDAVSSMAGNSPWAVNLSVGRSAGSHDATSPVEQGMQELLRLGPNRAICQSCGNYRSADLAVHGRLRDGEYRDLAWIIDPKDTTANEIDAWYSGKDRFVIGIRPPNGSAFTEARLGEACDIMRDGTLIGRIYHRKDDPNNRDNHVEVFLYPGAPPGEWTVRLSGEYVISGRFHAWIERDQGRPGAQSRFPRKIASRSYTLGTIATSPLVITVGAYDANSRGKSLAPFSSCGPTRDERHDKPELLAPGVGEIAARSIPRGAHRQEGLLVARSGTSMAAPHVAGTVCAMFEAAGRPVSIDEIRDCLRRSAEPIADAGRGDCGAWGRLDAAASIRSIRKLKEPMGDYAMENFTGFGFAEDEQAIKDALARKDWPLALKLKIESGSRDVNELTNLIFFARHPELPKTRLDAKDPNFEKLSKEWSTIQDSEIWKAIAAAARNTDLVVAGDEVSDHHRRFFQGKSGKRLKTLVENAAREAGLNPGLLGTIMMAETRRPQSYLSSEKVSSYHIGADDFFKGRAGMEARVPAYKKIKWDKKQKPGEHPNDAQTNPRMVKTILFDSGPDAVLATAVYVKFREVRLREIAKELGGDFDSLPLAVQMALSRMAMAAGTGGATPFLKQALKGGDIFIRKAIPVVAYQTQRNATVRTAQAMHLSEWVFGIPVPAAVKPPAALKEEIMDQEAETSVMDLTADGFLDRAEQVLRGSHGGRRQLETTFLGRLLSELDDNVPAPGLTPAELLRIILSNRRSMQGAYEMLHIIALPSRRPDTALRKGDWMIRAVPGTGDMGHVAILASDDLLPQPMLAPEGIAAESTQPGHYGLVIEAGAFPHSRARPFARRWLDERGRVLPHTVVLRPRYADPDAMADFPNNGSGADEYESAEFFSIGSTDREELPQAALGMTESPFDEADEAFGANAMAAEHDEGSNDEASAWSDAEGAGSDLAGFDGGLPPSEEEKGKAVDRCRENWLAEIKKLPEEVRTALLNIQTYGWQHPVAWAIKMGIRDAGRLNRIAYFGSNGESLGYCAPQTARAKKIWAASTKAVAAFLKNPWPTVFQSGPLPCSKRQIVSSPDKPSVDLTGRYYTESPAITYVINQAGVHIEGFASPVRLRVDTSPQPEGDHRPLTSFEGEVRSDKIYWFNRDKPENFGQFWMKGNHLYLGGQLLKPMEKRPTLFIGTDPDSSFDLAKRHELTPLTPNQLAIIRNILNPYWMNQIFAKFHNDGNRDAVGDLLRRLINDPPCWMKHASVRPWCEPRLEQFYEVDLPLVRQYVQLVLTAQTWKNNRNTTLSHVQWIQRMLDITLSNASDSTAHDLHKYTGLKPSKGGGTGQHRYEFDFTLNGLSVLLAGYSGTLTVSKTTGPRTWKKEYFIELWGGNVSISLVDVKLHSTFKGVAQSDIEWTENDIPGSIRFARASASVGMDVASAQVGFMHLFGNESIPMLPVFFQDASLGYPNVFKILEEKSKASIDSSTKFTAKGVLGLDAGVSVLFGTISPLGDALQRLGLRKRGYDPVDLSRTPKWDVSTTHNLAAEVHFCFDTDTPTEAARQAIRIMCARELAQLMSPGSTLAVIGHADTIGKPKYNKDLSERRARKTVDAIKEILGSKKFQIPEANIKIEGKGEDFAAEESKGKTVAAPKHRRVQIFLNAKLVLTLYSDTKQPKPKAPTTTGTKAEWLEPQEWAEADAGWPETVSGEASENDELATFDEFDAVEQPEEVSSYEAAENEWLETSDEASAELEQFGEFADEHGAESDFGGFAGESQPSKEEREYPNARIIPGSGEAADDSEASEETWIEEQVAPAGPSALRVRILWPALGFPAVIAPREVNARGSIAADATRCISLLVLANRTLTRDDVARHLRCVSWDNRWQRHIPEGTTAGTFRPAEISVRADVKSDPLSLSTPGNRLISLVGFGGGKGEKSAIIGGIAKAVLDFYGKKLPENERLPYLHEIRISEDASNRFADGQYHLFWNNVLPAQDAPSDEMRLLIDYHAHPLREHMTWSSYEGSDEKLNDLLKEFLKEYEFEYGIMHQPYQQAYSQLTMRRPRAEVLHPLFVKRVQAEPLRVGHLTDLHVDVRADVYEANLEAAMKFVPKADYLAAFNKAWETLRQRLVAKKRSPAPWRNKADLDELANLSRLPADLVLEIAASQKLTKYWRKDTYNNLNRSFRENYTKAKGESDILLLTGDLIDYGRGHFGVTERARLGDNTAYHEDRNWFLFYWLLAGDKSYTVPSYTILGNHDWRVNPYPPFAIAGAPSVESILNNYEEIVPEFRKWLLQIAHGPGHERAFSYVSTAVGVRDLLDKDPAAALSAAGKLAKGTRRLNIKDAPTETTIASVMWYLLTINPFLDYSFPHPSGQKLLMLDWAEAEDVMFPIVERGKSRGYEPWEAERASGPGPQAGDCLTAAQQKMVANFVARPGVSKLVGIHAPPIAPYGDWFDSELVKSRKTFPDFSKEASKLDCEALGGKWDEARKKCAQKDEPRGPDIVSVLASGKKKWNGHPFFAIRPPKAFDGMVANYGSLVKGRDEFIRQLIDPNHGVRAVFAGHNHRDGLHMLWRMGPESGEQTNGTLRVRLIAAPLSNVKPGAVKPGGVFGPLWVNTTSAGYRGHYRPSPGKQRYVPPGRALVSVRRDGTIEAAQFRQLPEIVKIPNRAPVPVPVP